ncbi:MAG: twin-arginine translocase TatA/TatE family subunit [Verrucomicrobia bacterium]|nr:twin-arginine translocase TatA/TatE family subunit [Verrucomicrobiota bacterium]
MYLQLAVLSEWHLVLLAVIVFLLFGGKKLPELARGIGQAMKEFKKASREAEDAIHGVDSTPSSSANVPTPQEPDNGSKSS